MEKLEQQLEKYHIKRIRCESNKNAEDVNNLRDELIEKYSLDIESFQDKYINYIKELVY